MLEKDMCNVENYTDLLFCKRDDAMHKSQSSKICCIQSMLCNAMPCHDSPEPSLNGLLSLHGRRQCEMKVTDVPM